MGAARATLYPYALVVRDGVPQASIFGAARRLCRRRRRHAERCRATTTSRTKARRRRHSSRPAAGSASPTNTGWRPSCRRRTRASTAPTSPRRSAAPKPMRRTIASAPKTAPQAARWPVVQRLFAGAKVGRTLRHYEDKLGIPKFDMAIDWGWFWFFTQPLFWLLDPVLQAAWQCRPRHPAADRRDQARHLPARRCVGQDR